MFRERSVLGGGFSLEIVFHPDEGYRLSCRQGKKVLVEYKGDARRHGRTVRGRESAYEFKSVEKLRYDFERDAQDAQRQG